MEQPRVSTPGLFRVWPFVRPTWPPRTIVDMAHPDDSHLIDTLVKARARGDEAAVNAAAWALVEHHMGWIVTLQRRYERRSWPATARDDYRQEMVAAAFRGVRRYDPERGATVASWITHSTRKAAGYVTDQVHPLGLRPGASAHARRSGKGAARITTTALDAHMRSRPDDDSPTLGDHLGVNDPDVADDLVQAARIRKLLELVAGIPDPPRGRGRHIILRRFGLDGSPPETTYEIAARLGVTPQAVSYAGQRAVDRLAHPIALRQIVRARP